MELGAGLSGRGRRSGSPNTEALQARSGPKRAESDEISGVLWGFTACSRLTQFLAVGWLSLQPMPWGGGPTVSYYHDRTPISLLRLCSVFRICGSRANIPGNDQIYISYDSLYRNILMCSWEKSLRMIFTTSDIQESCIKILLNHICCFPLVPFHPLSVFLSFCLSLLNIHCPHFPF